MSTMNTINLCRAIVIALAVTAAVFADPPRGVLVPTFDDLSPSYDDSELRGRIESIEATLEKIAEAMQPKEPPAEPDPIEPDPDPPVVDPPVIPDPPAGRITADRFRLVGGWRIAQPFAKPGLAIDFEAMRAYVGSHAQKNRLDIFDLPPMGEGDDMAAWPRVDSEELIDRFWDGGNARGVELRDGVLWVSTKVFYDTSPGTIALHGKDLSTGEVETLPIDLSKPAFGGGFIKGHPTDWMIGCGGYESGQGSVAGPTAARVDGTILLNQSPHGTMAFENRELREANYFAESDTWVALNPRDGIGRWAADRVYAGGIWRPDGLLYWPIMGVGEIDYRQQNETFSGDRQQSYLYTYNPETFDQVAFERWPYGVVIGQEVDSEGRIYLLVRNAWRSARYLVDPAILVFEVIE